MHRLTNSYEEKMSGQTVVATLWQASYGYDNANRLTTFTPNPMAQNNPPPTATMTQDSDNQLATFNGQSVGHDADGNLLNAPVVSGTQLGALTWDKRNRLTSAGGITYAYDAENRRTRSVATGGTTTYIYSRGAKLDRLLVKQNPDGSLTRYIHGAGLLYEETTNAQGVAQSPVYYHYDWRGDTVALSDSTGNVTARLSYSPYGVPTVESGTVTTPFCFNGKWGVMTETTGLLSMQARYYSPIMQRFLNEDPSGFDGGVNLYAFANGDPIDSMDPFGLCPAAVTSGGNSNIYASSNTSVGAATVSQPTGEGSPVYDPISQTVGYTGLAASTLQYSAAGQYSVGSNYKVYTSGWGGNGSVSTTKLGGIAEAAGPALAITSVGVDLYGYSQGNISGAHLTTNTTMTGVGFLGVPGAVVAGGYFLIDTFYPAKDPKAGGAAAAVNDAATIRGKQIEEQGRTYMPFVPSGVLP